MGPPHTYTHTPLALLGGQELEQRRGETCPPPPGPPERSGVCGECDRTSLGSLWGRGRTETPAVPSTSPP